MRIVTNPRGRDPGDDSRLLDFSFREKNLGAQTEVSVAPGPSLAADPLAELGQQSVRGS